MAEKGNTLKTRIQMKSDTEENWRKAVLTTDHPLGQKNSGTSFVPLLGELIVFEEDATHPFSRLKVGNGQDNVLSLDFIDAGTINGQQLRNEVVRYARREDFPSPGDLDKIYIDESTNKIYYYISANGYTLLSNYTYTVEKTSVGKITSWSTGTLPSIVCEGGIAKFSSGELPKLNYYDINVVTNVTKEAAHV